MAEVLEDDMEGDSDRRNDERSFLKEKFDVFVEEYRETAEPHAGSSIRSDTPSDAALKKDVVNMKRKLNRAKFFVQAAPDAEMMSGYINNIDSITRELDTLVLGRKDAGGEFTIRNVPLPDFDATDIELLMGNDAAGANEDTLTVWDRTQRSRVKELMTAAQGIIDECDAARRLQKAVME